MRRFSRSCLYKEALTLAVLELGFLRPFPCRKNLQLSSCGSTGVRKIPFTTWTRGWHSHSHLLLPSRIFVKITPIATGHPHQYNPRQYFLYLVTNWIIFKNIWDQVLFFQLPQDNLLGKKKFWGRKCLPTGCVIRLLLIFTEPISFFQKGEKATTDLLWWMFKHRFNFGLQEREHSVVEKELEY